MPVSVAAAVAHPVSPAATAARVAVGMLAKWSAPEVRGGRAASVIGACSWPSMQAREVVEVTGGEPPNRRWSRWRCGAGRRRRAGPRLRPWATTEESAAAAPMVNRGAAGVRDTPYDRAPSAPRSRLQARDDVPMTHFRAAASHPLRTSGGNHWGWPQMTDPLADCYRP